MRHDWKKNEDTYCGIGAYLIDNKIGHAKWRAMEQERHDHADEINDGDFRGDNLEVILLRFICSRAGHTSHVSLREAADQVLLTTQVVNAMSTTVEDDSEPASFYL